MLLGGDGHSYAAAMPHGKIRHERQVRKALRHDMAKVHNVNHHFNDVTLDREHEFLVADQIEDDDNGGNPFAKKLKVPATGYAVYAYRHAVFDLQPKNTFLISPSFNGPVAHIYILQRNIRI
jgi:hypothetical protein